MSGTFDSWRNGDIVPAPTTSEHRRGFHEFKLRHVVFHYDSDCQSEVLNGVSQRVPRARLVNPSNSVQPPTENNPLLEKYR
jgi:hypothetical protein